MIETVILHQSGHILGVPGLLAAGVYTIEDGQMVDMQPLAAIDTSIESSEEVTTVTLHHEGYILGVPSGTYTITGTHITEVQPHVARDTTVDILRGETEAIAWEAMRTDMSVDVLRAAREQSAILTIESLESRHGQQESRSQSEQGDSPIE